MKERPIHLQRANSGGAAMSSRARWGTRECPPSGVHFFRRDERGVWHSACGLVVAVRLTRKARQHAGMAARGYCCELCKRKVGPRLPSEVRHG